MGQEVVQRACQKINLELHSGGLKWQTGGLQREKLGIAIRLPEGVMAAMAFKGGWGVPASIVENGKPECTG
eukprot:1156480-Pelagomonas_calceolata.AAC.8